jgi:hypothetical protein
MKVARIDERRALTRQLQQLFHDHLVGVASWEELSIDPPIENARVPGEPREAGRYKDLISGHIGGLVITLIGPAEDSRYPCGLASVKGPGFTVRGPLDARTFEQIADEIKEHKKLGEQNGATAGEDWGRR